MIDSIQGPGLSAVVVVVVATAVMITAMRRSRRRHAEKLAEQGKTRGRTTQSPPWISILVVGTIVLLTRMMGGQGRGGFTPGSVNLVGVGTIVVGLIALGTLGAWRWLRPANPTPAPERQSTSGWTWVYVGYCLLLGFKIAALRRPGSLLDAPWLTWVLVFAPVLFVGYAIGKRWDRHLRRANRKASRGDVAGAIADLVAVVDRRRGPASEFRDLADDPWAPPRSALQGDARLASRLNALGVLEGMRHEWSRAFDWFHAAERAGDPATRAVFLGNQGVALVKLGRLAEGAPLLRQAIERSNAPDHSLRCQLLVRLATGLIDDGQGNEAQKVLDRAQEEWRRFKIYPASAKQPLQTEIEALRARLASAPTEQPRPPGRSALEPFQARVVPPTEHADLDAQGDRR